MREARLMWFGYVRRRCAKELVRRCENLAIAGFRRVKGNRRRTRGR